MGLVYRYELEMLLASAHSEEIRFWSGCIAQNCDIALARRSEGPAAPESSPAQKMANSTRESRPR